jgi:GNAT superfamily N-acetyltransferase
MLFEPIISTDLDEIRGLRPEGWDDIVPDFQFYINSPFCTPVKTKENGKIVGIGSFINFGDTSWIGHMIVNKDYRNRGIGYQTFKKLLENLDKNSIETCLLVATEMGRPVYLKAGFRDVAEYVFLQRERPWQDRQVDFNVTTLEKEHYTSVYELDRKVSGENRQKLISMFLKGSFVYLSNNDVKGFYLPNLKEGLIIAENEEAGIALMEIKYSKSDKAVLPSDNAIGIRFLEQNGFAQTDKKGTRMIYGKSVSWEPQKLYSRIGGNLG